MVLSSICSAATLSGDLLSTDAKICCHKQTELVSIETVGGGAFVVMALVLTGVISADYETADGGGVIRLFFNSSGDAGSVVL
jgi:hypothetical protein